MKKEWPKVRLGEVLRQVERPEAIDASRVYRLIGVRWYGLGLFVREEKIGADIAANRVYSVQPGDFVYNRLFAWKGSFAVAGPESSGAYVSNEFPCFLADRARLDPYFLLWLFREERAWTKVLGLSMGATPTSRNRLKESVFLAMEVPLPPLAEQRRVVARIEELAAQVHEARPLRQHVAREMEALLSSFVSRLCGSAEWDTTTMGDLVGRDSLRNGKSVKSSDVGAGVRCLTLSALRRGRIDIRESKPVPLTAKEAKPFLVRNQDVFIVRGNGSKDLCGLAGMNSEECESVIFPDLFIRVSLPKERISPKFFVAVWNSSTTRIAIEEKAKTTSGIWKINQDHIASIRIPVPPMAQQHRIVAELDALQAEVDTLKRLQTETSAELDVLLPAILDRAFQGAL
jgi:type I restriction enzyme S subunit